MLTKVEARNARGSLLSLELEDSSGGYFVREILGLDPVKATIATSAFAQQDGVQLHSARREGRNIVIKLGFDPDYATTSISALRRNLYSYFMTKAPVNLRFYDDDDDLVAEINGVVESCEAPLFVKEPQIDISVFCEEPDFLDMETVEINGSTTDDSTEIEIEYTGSVETGLELVLSIDRTLDEFTIYHRSPSNVTKAINVVGSFLEDDILRINTTPGLKGAILTRESVDSSLLNGLLPPLNWTELTEGSNYIRVYAEGESIPYEIIYKQRYGGL